LVYVVSMIAKNIAPAKSRLSELVNAALAGEEVVLCKNGTPVVRLTPIRPMNPDDPCRVIPDLVVKTGDEGMKPLPPEEWGKLSG
jgi:prevent-host-death family protein